MNPSSQPEANEVCFCPKRHLPLPMAGIGTEACVVRVRGCCRDVTFLKSLGFVSGSKVCILSELGANLIIKVKETRMAIAKPLAMKILVRTSLQE